MSVMQCTLHGFSCTYYYVESLSIILSEKNYFAPMQEILFSYYLWLQV